MNSSQAIKDEIVKYFSQFTNRKIDEHTAINNDIGLTVSEFYDICVFFKRKFNIDLNDMDENIYFKDEVSNPLRNLFKLGKTKNDILKRPLTIGHLMTVVQAGKWSDPL